MITTAEERVMIERLKIKTKDLTAYPTKKIIHMPTMEFAYSLGTLLTSVGLSDNFASLLTFDSF